MAEYADVSISSESTTEPGVALNSTHTLVRRLDNTSSTVESLGNNVVFGAGAGVCQPSFSNPFMTTESRCNFATTCCTNPSQHEGNGVFQSNCPVFNAPNITFNMPSSSFGLRLQLRPSVLRPTADFSVGSVKPSSSGILRPAKLPDPCTPCQKGGEDACKDVLSVTADRDRPTSTSTTSAEVLLSTRDAVLPMACGGAGENFAADLSKNNRLKDSVRGTGNSSTNFVFGKNLSQRVMGLTDGSMPVTYSDVTLTSFTSPSSALPTVTAMPSCSLPNGTGQLLADYGYDGLSACDAVTAGVSVTSQRSPTGLGVDSDVCQGIGDRPVLTLEESARQYQVKHDHRVDLKEVEVITGEEDESNVLQANGKLFIFDVESQAWLERGSGNMRLNDISHRLSNCSTFRSRLVMRIHGSLRVILNTKIWSGMSVEQASSKAIRFSATDCDQTIRVFLFMTIAKDLENLLRAIDRRIHQLKLCEGCVLPYERVYEGMKRKAVDPESPPSGSFKHKKVDGVVTGVMRKEESDSSVQDPETEASCESQASSLTLKSESD